MIKRLKIKYIILALSSLFLLLTFIVAGMNLSNYKSVIGNADKTLTLLSNNHGAFPEYDNGGDDWLPSGMSRETPFESRYFSVVIGSTGETIFVGVSSIG